jgi:DNA-binding NarL/FixJ family response regulator
MTTPASREDRFKLSAICRKFPRQAHDLEVASGRVGSNATEARPIRILLVDDDPSFLRSLEVLLTDAPGLEIVAKAASGAEALAAATRAEPDVAVIDVLMPVMSGIECANLLQERYPKVQVILISGSIFEDRRPHPDERGTDAYIEKSEVPERLHATILALAAETTAAPSGRTHT